MQALGKMEGCVSHVSLIVLDKETCLGTTMDVRLARSDRDSPWCPSIYPSTTVFHRFTRSISTTPAQVATRLIMQVVTKISNIFYISLSDRLGSSDLLYIHILWPKSSRGYSNQFTRWTPSSFISYIILCPLHESKKYTRWLFCFHPMLNSSNSNQKSRIQ